MMENIEPIDFIYQEAKKLKKLYKDKHEYSIVDWSKEFGQLIVLAIKHECFDKLIYRLLQDELQGKLEQFIKEKSMVIQAPLLGVCQLLYDTEVDKLVLIPVPVTAMNLVLVISTEPLDFEEMDTMTEQYATDFARWISWRLEEFYDEVTSFCL